MEVVVAGECEGEKGVADGMVNAMGEDQDSRWPSISSQVARFLVFHGKYQRIRFSVFRLERMPNAFESNPRSRVVENVEMHRVNLHCRRQNRKRVLHMQLPLRVYFWKKFGIKKRRSRNRILGFSCRASCQRCRLQEAMASHYIEYIAYLCDFSGTRKLGIKKKKKFKNRNGIVEFYYRYNKIILKS